jgi:hypothetical protein
MTTAVLVPLQRVPARPLAGTTVGAPRPILGCQAWVTGPDCPTGAFALPGGFDFVNIEIVPPSNSFWGVLNNLIFNRLGHIASTRAPADYVIQADGCLEWAIPSSIFAEPNEQVAACPASRLIERIRHASTLTIEMIAPLVGVSRRSIHSWLGGGQISQRNEERLRALAEAIEAIAAIAPNATRARLLERVPGSVRVYDLLAEGNYGAAIERTKNTPRPAPAAHYPAPRPLTSSLVARVAALNDPPIPLDGLVDRRFTKRLKR